MTARQHHLCIIAAGTVCLIALAALLWTPDPAYDVDGGLDAAEAEAARHCRAKRERPLPVAPTRVASYCNGRTTIEPLISTAALARRGL